MDSVTAILVREHEAIVRMLDAADAAAARFRDGESVPHELLGQICAFLVNYADRWHHAKEEELLFPEMEAKGIPRDQGPIGVMLAEHVEARRLTAELGVIAGDHRRGDATAPERWNSVSGAYTGLLRDHIAKENEVLFPMADGLFSPEEQENLLRHFAEAEQSFGPALGVEMLAELDHVTEALGLGRPAQ